VFQSDSAHPLPLTPAAQHILTHLPESLRRGKVIQVRVLAEITGYSIGTVHTALRELARHGYLERVMVGRSGRRHVYRAKADRLFARAGGR
jgi:DNA-binding MarR family transcriptional regulator